MKLLFVSPNLPYPPDNGGKIRIFNLIKQLSFLHEITLVCFVWKHTGETGYIEELGKYCRKIINRELTGKCGKCKDKLICGGCRARALILNNDLRNSLKTKSRARAEKYFSITNFADKFGKSLI